MESPRETPLFLGPKIDNWHPFEYDPTMRDGDLVKLEVKPRSIGNIIDYVTDRCAGKKVLNLGALGDIKFYLPHRKDLWLHENISSVATKAVGLDLDEEGCQHAKENNYEILHGDCETMKLGQKFDVIVMYEIIEHLNAPVTALINILNHLEEGGELIITTPNPTALPSFVATLTNRSPNVFYDHVSEFSPENLQAIGDRLNSKITDVSYFTRFDGRTAKLKIKSHIIRSLGKALPRLHYQFAVVMKNVH